MGTTVHDYRSTTALVTGASKGIGLATATALARRGADLVLVARSRTTLDGIAERLRADHGVSVRVIPADLADPDGVQKVLEGLRAGGITVDLLVNNAGTGSVGPHLERPLRPQLDSVSLNISTLLTLTHHIGAGMRARGSGGIINIASTAAFQPMPYQASYAATKAFALSFSEALAEELRGSGVRVMVAHPGATATNFFDGTSAEIAAGLADSAEDVAEDVLDDYARGRTASYPGRAVNRVGTFVARALPRRTVTRLTGALNRKLGFHLAQDTAASHHPRS
ncbi:short-subunit dehydrogenase [Saccharothrix coeruleofusca]|uniref:SDR family NAD(P)-dependent oxidoreductase n=1 Tax=Saccharothrix coeruleofusca TaxID=33919 RepID=UPI001AE67CFA|nr:SDR family oxidoreductase [Saccharothrix coeruleofusca]MBP2335679.1 short-subunit dehydrogenase [Saccharothrix coeruleofusca]